MNKKRFILTSLLGLFTIGSPFADNLALKNNNDGKPDSLLYQKPLYLSQTLWYHTPKNDIFHWGLTYALGWFATPTFNARVPLLAILDEKNKITSLCSATLIDKTQKKILTTAHCVLKLRKKKAGVGFDTNDLVNTNNIKILFAKKLGSRGTLAMPVNIVNEFRSPDGITMDDNKYKDTYNVYNVNAVYVPSSAFRDANINSDKSFTINDDQDLNDLAILELKENLDDLYLETSLNTNPIKNNTPLVTASYGVTRYTTQEPKMLNESQDYTKLLYPGILRSVSGTVDSVKEHSYSVSGEKSESNFQFCNGNSGGADFEIRDNNELVLVGVHSYGYGDECGNPRYLGWSTNVSSYSEWINGDYKKTPHSSIFHNTSQIDCFEITGTTITGIKTNCYESIEELIIPPGITTIGDYAFDYTKYHIKRVIMSDVTNIGMLAFRSYKKDLTAVYMPKVKTIGRLAFVGNNFTSISMPEVKTIGDYAFYHNENLRSVYMPKVKTIGDRAFFDMPIQTVIMNDLNLCNFTFGNSICLNHYERVKLD